MSDAQPDKSSQSGAASSGGEPVGETPSEQVEHWLEMLRERAEGLRGACTHTDTQYITTLAGRLAEASANVPDDQTVHVGRHLECMALANEADVTAIHEQIEDLITLCQRMANP